MFKFLLNKKILLALIPIILFFISLKVYAITVDDLKPMMCLDENSFSQEDENFGGRTANEWKISGSNLIPTRSGVTIGSASFDGSFNDLVINGTCTGCGTGAGASGGGWSTSTDGLVLYPAATSSVVVIGSDATTTTGKILEIVGNMEFDFASGTGITATTFWGSLVGNVTGTASGNLTSANIDTLAELNAILTGEDVASTSGTYANMTVGVSNELTCTNCINATEIEDIYLLTAGDSMTGNLGFINASGTLISFTTAWGNLVGNVTGTASGNLTSANIDTLAELNAILTGEDVASTTYFTAGDALTLTGADFDFDGGSAPAGTLGGTWASPTVDSDGTWTIHDSYPAACSAGQFVGTIGDTNTCSAPVGANEAYASGWNADTGVPEKDDIYDWGHVLDTDDDGLINGMDTDGVDAITEIAAALKDGSGDCATGLICLGDHTHSGYYDALTDITLTNGYIFSGNASNNPVATSTIFITSAGYVGIGTTTPTAKLVVGSGATATTTAQFGSATMGANPAKQCFWNGSNFTIEYYPVNSVTKTIATSTSCN